MSTTIVEVQSAVAEFDKVALGLAELEKQYKGVVYDVKTGKGMDEAKAARAAIREPRYEIERVRKAAKAPILKLGKELDSRAKEITEKILAIESPIDEQIKNEEARKEAEKQAKIEAEQRRVAELQERVAYLRGNQMLTAHSEPRLIADHIEELEKISVDETFQEFQERAAEAKAEGLAHLNTVYAAAVARVAEDERIKAEREELARLRVEQEKRDAEERARIAEEERKAKAERDAEAARQAAELKAAREKQEAEAAAERKRIAEEEAAARAVREAEEKKLAAERAAFERQQEEARRAREAEETRKAEQARIAALKKPDDAELIGVLCAHYQAPESKVIEWLLTIDFSKLEAAA